MAAAGIFFPVMTYRDTVQSGIARTIDNAFSQYAMLIGILLAIFCSFFVGTDYSDGTLRNKVVAGKKRIAIYGANLVTCILAGLFLCAGFFTPYLCIGIPLLGFFTVDLKIVLLFAVTVIALSAAFSSIFALAAMLNSNKAATAVLCVLMAFLLLFAGMKLNGMLNEPETMLGGDNGRHRRRV